jgi:N-acetylglucosamine malate deacetylase 1
MNFFIKTAFTAIRIVKSSFEANANTSILKSFLPSIFFNYLYSMKLDILAIGAHPDDIELSCSGTIIKEINRGKRVGVLDLTEGELGTRGTVATRYDEAAQAALIMGLAVRENLQLADGFFKNDQEHQIKLIESIRHYQPDIILCNAPEDRHPDHGRSAQLVVDACFLSGLAKIETFKNEEVQKAWRPKYVFHFIQDRYLHPDFVIDITEVHDKKIASIKAYKTQFYDETSAEPATYISSPQFLDGVIYRSKMMGKMIGVSYAEGFISKKMIGFSDFDAFILQDT